MKAPLSVLAILLFANQGIALGAAGGAVRQAAVDPCSLLNDNEVRQSFPRAGAAERNRRVEKDGAAGCQWRNDKGIVLLQLILYEGPPRSVRRESQAFSHAMIDTARVEAPDAIRYEPIDSLGDEAVAVVERTDQANGLLGNVAFLVAQRGTRLLFISSADLAGRDRAAGLKALEALGRAAVNRL
jgi:hypothetical protein